MKTLSQSNVESDSVTEEGQSSLISKNITIFNRRTSVRLEPEMWDALKDISVREQCTVHDICSLVYVRKGKDTSLTAAIRVFLMLYYRSATTEDGHRNAGHGDFSSMKTRARISPEHEALFQDFRRKKRFSSFEELNDN